MHNFDGKNQTIGRLTAKQKRTDDNSWIATHGPFLLRSAFQPIFRFTGGQLRPIAFEALLRPFVDDLPVIPSAFFNELSPKENWEIEAISRTLHVRNAARLNKKAKKLFLNFNPSVMTSETSLDFTLDHLSVELKMSGLATTDCVCEITERAAANESVLQYFAYALRARGYKIAVDDFGADASDMSRITELTPDIVKFDGAMVKLLMESADGFKQIKDMLTEFHALRIVTIVEGLEEPWQIEMAESAGAEYIQGYAAAVPRTMPANFNEWFVEEDEFKERPFLSRPASGAL